MIKAHRKKIISNLASFVAEEHSDGIITNLQSIIDFESLPVHYDHYEDCFDGILLHDGSDFHIHINLDKGNTITSKRGRFTLAHELGHFFIDEHRIGLKYGLLDPHPSFNNFNHHTLIELEADYFASCLLMPYDKYKAFCARKPFSFELIRNISESFQTSIMATILRFIEAGSREFMVVVSKNSIVKWFAKTPDFPLFAFKFKVGQKVPTRTVAESFYKNPLPDFQSDVINVSPQDWFFVNDGRANKNLYEQCYFSMINNYLISLIWFD